jgi:hypothetical protein
MMQLLEEAATVTVVGSAIADYALCFAVSACNYENIQVSAIS